MAVAVKDVVLKRVLIAYESQIQDATFNGIKLGEINDGLDDDSLRLAIEELGPVFS